MHLFIVLMSSIYALALTVQIMSYASSVKKTKLVEQKVAGLKLLKPQKI
jgi:hypothetical protein